MNETMKEAVAALGFTTIVGALLFLWIATP
jgi:hypothetical protein